MLLKRIITAIILIPLVVLGIFYLPALAFTGITVLLFGFAAFEIAGLFWPKRIFYRSIFLVFLFLLFVVSFILPVLPILILGSLWWVFLAPYFLVRFSGEHGASSPKFPPRLITGIFTFIPAAIALLTLRFDFGAKYLALFLVIIWAADIGAYFSGMLWGKRKLAPKISPKKTIVGVGGGLVLALIAAIGGGLFIHLPFRFWVGWLLLVLVVVLWSVIGDLFASMLKRIGGVKDSGNLLPGHGGLYDRIDSLTAALPLFTLGLLLFRL